MRPASEPCSVFRVISFYVGQDRVNSEAYRFDDTRRVAIVAGECCRVLLGLRDHPQVFAHASTQAKSVGGAIRTCVVLKQVFAGVGQPLSVLN